MPRVSYLAVPVQSKTIAGGVWAELGLKAATAETTLTGTLVDLAPEVLAGHSPTTSSDVYALGVMLYQMLVGDCLLS
ncbi:MAG TPA: hypothetical protein VIW68_01100 [Candidatus Sulfotelmatobacter sp.]